MKLRVNLILLCALLVAAHFLRSYNLIPVLLCLAAPLLLLIRRRWVVYLLQALTLIVSGIWFFTLANIMAQRQLENRSWTASAIILGLVILFNLFSGWSLNQPEFKRNYPG